MPLSFERWRPKKAMRVLAKVVAALLLLAPVVSAQTFSAVSVDEKGQVTATTAHGGMVKLSAHGRSPAISDDQRTVAWLELRTIEYRDEKVQVAKFLRWSRSGVRRSVSAGPFAFREFWFLDGGAKIAASLGAMHFAGVSLLFDANSGRELERYPDVSDAPAPSWARRAAN